MNSQAPNPGEVWMSKDGNIRRVEGARVVMGADFSISGIEWRGVGSEAGFALTDEWHAWAANATRVWPVQEVQAVPMTGEELQRIWSKVFQDEMSCEDAWNALAAHINRASPTRQQNPTPSLTSWIDFCNATTLE